MSLPLDVLPALDELDEVPRTGAQTVTRQGARVKSASGVYTPGPTTTITLRRAASWPISGTELMMEPEADRVAGMRRFVTDIRLHVGDGGSSDIINRSGERWRVKRCEHYAAAGNCWISDTVRLEAEAP